MRHMQQQERTRLAVEQYLFGKSAREIARDFGVSHQRIYQMLDVAGLDSGARAAMRATRRAKVVSAREAEAAKRRAKSDAYKRAKWGISLEEYAAIAAAHGRHGSGARSPFSRYTRWRENCRKHGVPQALPFVDWWSVWQDSGHYEDMGRGVAYWLTRRDPSKPLDRSNAIVRLSSDVAREARERERAA